MTFLYYFLNGALLTFLPQFIQLATEGDITSFDGINEIQWTVLVVSTLIGGFREWRNRMAKPPTELTQEQQKTLQELETKMVQRTKEQSTL